MRKVFILGLCLAILLSITAVSAAENDTALADLPEIAELETAVDSPTPSSDFDDGKQQVEIIAHDIDMHYSAYYGFIFSIEDENGDPVYDVDKLKMVYDNGAEVIGENIDDGDYLFYLNWVGNHNATVMVSDSYYKADSVTINVKISKAPVKIAAKQYYSNTKHYSILKAVVRDSEGDPIDEGTVKFRVGGTNYYAKVVDGVATKKVMLKKAKTYVYTATYQENRHYRNSKTASSKVYVYSSSKKARTINIKGYKVTLTQKQYNNLINAKNTNKVVWFELKTNKYVKQNIVTYTSEYEWKYMGKVSPETANERGWKTKNFVKHWVSDGECYYTCDAYKKVLVTKAIRKTVKARVSIMVSYGGKTGGQTAPANKYLAYLNTPYQNPGYEICKPWVTGSKKSSTIDKLNSAK